MKKIPILEAIAFGHFEEALQVLLDATKGTSNQTNAILLSARFTEYKKAKINQNLSDNDLHTLQVRLNQSFIGTIEMAELSHLEVAIKGNTITSTGTSSLSVSKEIKILFLGVQPKGTRRLEIDKESKNTQERIKMSKYRDLFTFKDIRAVTPTDLLSNLVNEVPNIVHFSGHGYEEDGLVFEDNDGKPQPIAASAIGELFRMITEDAPIKCVILNACYSEPVAKEIVKYVDYVVGMKDALPDVSAVAFSIGFYDILGADDKFNVEKAFKAGRLNILLNSHPKADLLVLHQKGEEE